MRPTRIVPALLVAVLLCGCGTTPPSDSATEKPDGGKPATPAAASPKDLDAAKKFAVDFLAAVRDKKANTAQLSVEFKKVFAPPALEADKAQGYSDAVAATELGYLATEVGADEVTAVGGPDGAVFAVGRGKVGGRTLLRVVKAGADWKVDWLSVGAKGSPDGTLNGADAPAQFAAQAFADAVLRKKFAHAAALLTDAARTRYGESPIDKKFDAGALKNKLEEFFPGIDKYTVAGTSGGTVTLDVSTAGRKKTVAIKAVKGTRPGGWLVDAVEVK